MSVSGCGTRGEKAEERRARVGLESAAGNSKNRIISYPRLTRALPFKHTMVHFVRFSFVIREQSQVFSVDSAERSHVGLPPKNIFPRFEFTPLQVRFSNGKKASSIYCGHSDFTESNFNVSTSISWRPPQFNDTAGTYPKRVIPTKHWQQSARCVWVFLE